MRTNSAHNFSIGAEEVRQTILDRVDEGYWDDDVTSKNMHMFASDEGLAEQRINEIINRFDFERVYQALESCESDIIDEIEYDIFN
mgnify:CR=1 FL=1